MITKKNLLDLLECMHFIENEDGLYEKNILIMIAL